MFSILARKFKALLSDLFMIPREGESREDFLERVINGRRWNRLSEKQKDSLIIAYQQDLTHEEDARQKEAHKRASRGYNPHNEEILKYYNQRPNSPKRYIMILDRLYQDILEYKFEEFSSVMQVNRKVVVEDISYKERYTQYEKLSNFDLKYHTLGVFRRAIKLTEGKMDTFSNQVAILAIAHDFGKCHTIREVLGIPKNKRIPHNVISGMYLRKVCVDMGYKEDGEVLEEMLAHHHVIVEKGSKSNYDKDSKNRNSEYQNNIFIKMLNQADYEQRDEELSLFDDENAEMSIVPAKRTKKVSTKSNSINPYEKQSQKDISSLNSEAISLRNNIEKFIEETYINNQETNK